MTIGEIMRAAHNFAFSSLSERLGAGGLIVVAPHPDDESLACGGLIAQAHSEQRAIRVVIVSDGAGSHPASQAYPADRLRRLREAEAAQAVRELGLDPSRDLVFLRLPDRFVPSEGPLASAAIQEIANCVKAVEAQAIFVSWRHDPHCDHQACYRIVRAVQVRMPQLALYEYSVWGAALPLATPIAEGFEGFRINIDRHQPRKRRAIAAHRSQITDLIDDDPGGFRLSVSDLRRFDLPYEFFFEGPL